MASRIEFFARARELERLRRPFATATVVRVERPTSGRPGDKAIVTLEGELYGWVGGSCARPTVIQEAARALREDRCRLIRLAPEPAEPTESDASSGREGITDLAMTCFSGGTMEIFIEPHQPPSKLIVVGDQPVAQALLKLGDVLGFEVGDTLESAGSHPLAFVVIATHGEGDEVALESALEKRAPYVGLVASRKRAGSIREYLKVRGLAQDVFDRLHAPAGLDIQAQSPEEVALSILAEIVQVRRNLETVDWESAGPSEAQQPAERKAGLDPVCGMSVQKDSARYTLEHAGAVYYFCCAGCREKFGADPAAYLST